MSNQFIKDVQPAILALADGSLFAGIAIGASGHAVGEVVFNTALCGYQEILTDPSYAEQIVTLTNPHIGNVGINWEDQESTGIWAKGLIIRELSPIVSNWRAQQSLVEYLIKYNVVAIAEIDTRRLTRLLRDKGAQNGCIMTGEVDTQQALQMARAYPGIKGKDLAKEVSVTQTYQWQEKVYTFPSHAVPSAEDQNQASSLNLAAFSSEQKNKISLKYNVVVYDFGVKQQILRLLVSNGCQVTVVPATTSATEVLALNPDGILLANGPGDPAACDYAIKTIQTLLKTEIPLFGICLGFQLLALAYGADTHKMKFGHHGANHPVYDLVRGTVAITSQNHGFCVEEASLPVGLQVTHRSLFDGTLQGFKDCNKPVFAFQGHPEASPGPHDINRLFADFVASMHHSVQKKSQDKNECQNVLI